MSIRFDLNGKSVEVEPRDDESLLDVLRNRCGITSLKDGCSPQGQCGCCLAMVGGKAVVTCAMKASKAAGKEVVTLDGLPGDETALIADCFAASAGLQCGFCIPGLTMRAHHLIQKNAKPSRDEIAKAIDVHLCRCTGYTKIVDAIELYAGVKRGEATVKLEGDGRVGKRLTRYQAQDLTLGRRDYVADMTAEGMLFGAVRLSDHARAKVIKIDTSRAEALEGVVKVATYRDVTGDRWYGLIQKDWPGLIAEGEEARCVGDFLAAVAAVDEHTARAAAALIDVEYEVLVPVTDMEAAIKPGAAQVNPTSTEGSNILGRTEIRRGDVEAAFASSAHVVEGRFHTQRIEHLFLEPECAFATPTESGQIRLYSQGQGIFDDRRQCAAFIGIPEEELQVELVPNGGAFGGKEDMSIQAHTTLLCQMTGKPVRLLLSREQSIRVHPKRHPLRMDYKVGCDADGKVTAVWADMLGDTGAYASVGAKVLERAAGHGCGPYRCDNVHIDAIATYTNNPPCGAMRGFGANQAHFAMSACLDMLAEKVGIDTWEIRHRNVVGIGDTFASGQIFEKSVGVKETLESVKDAYYAAKKAGKAVGIDCGIKNTGIGNGAVEWGKARLVVEKDGTISLYNGYTEMGQGLLTILTQCAVEVTGLEPTLFRPQVDSTFALGCGQTTGSRATLFGGRAVKSAAEKLKVALDSGKSLGDLVGEVFAADIVIDDTTAPGKQGDKKIKTHTAFGFATQLVILDADGRLEHVIASHDVGRAINPALCEGQIEGAVHMGLGFALSEDLPCEDGWPVTYKMREIGVMRARDMPTVEVILVEDHEPEGPFGAKGVGEIGLVPTAGAVAGALYAHDGERRYRLPMKESPAGKAISVGKIKKRPRA